MTRGRNGERDPLSRPWTKRALMRDLALGNTTQRELAAKYGVSEPAMTYFKQRNAEQIEDIRANAEGEFAGILISQKANRLQAYADLLEDADPKLATRVLRQIAEEMGHLPQRVQLSGQVDTQTRYQIDGVDPGDLR